ncbi:MAG: TolC family protein [Bacteroidia bacterium]|nr:TolC family protein [Bacteroidia bacterium]
MKHFFIFLLSGIITTKTIAQTAVAESLSFTLKQAVDFAMKNQNDIKNALLDERIAKANVNEITTMGLPQINSSFDLKDFIEIPTSLVPAEFFGGDEGTFAAVKFGTQYQATAGLDASQLLFSGDYFLGLKASKTFLEISKKSTQRTKIETTAQVSKAYYTVLVNQERMSLMNANVTRLKKAMDDTKALYENGFVEKIDYDRITVAYNNIVVEQDKVQRLVLLANHLLKFQMGMDIATNLTLTDKLEDLTLELKENISADKFDYNKRVEYNLFENQKALAKLDLKRNRFLYLPTAYAYGSISANAQRNEFDIFDTKKSWFPTALIGAKVTMPIFTSGQRHFKIQQAKLKYQQAENNMDFIKKSIDLELANAVTTLQNASQSLDIQKKNIALAEDVFRVAKLKQEQGVGSSLEVLTAETVLKEAQTNYFNALFEAVIAKINFDKANGTIQQ